MTNGSSKLPLIDIIAVQLFPNDSESTSNNFFWNAVSNITREFVYVFPYENTVIYST